MPETVPPPFYVLILFDEAVDQVEVSSYTHLSCLAVKLVRDLRREPGLDTLLPRIIGHVTRVGAGARLPAQDHTCPVRRTLGADTGIAPHTTLRLYGVLPSAVGMLLLFLGSVAEILRLLAITKTCNMGTESGQQKPQLVSVCCVSHQ